MKKKPGWSRQNKSFDASYGRHFKRIGASYYGTLSNWVSTIINEKLSERQKRNIADRAWDLYLNGSIVRGILESLVTEVVGRGLTPQPNPMIRYLELGSDWQFEFQQKAFDLFEVWGFDRNYCDATRRLNIYMLQTLALFCWKLEGIAIFQVIYEKDKKSPLQFSLLPIDPSRLQTPTDIKEDVYDGIKLDKNGAPEKVYIMKPSSKNKMILSAKKEDMREIPVINSDTGLHNILLVNDVRNIAEYRQDSIVSSMMKEIKDGEDAVDATIVKFLVSNLFALFVTDEGSFYETQKGENLNKLDWRERVHELEKGTILFGLPHEKPEVIKSGDQPGPEYDRLWKSIITRLGMVTGRGPEHTQKQYNNSYSASRASIENAIRFDDKDRQILENQFCNPSWTWLIHEAAVKGLLPVKSLSHFLENTFAYSRCDWLPPEERPIDQVKAKNAEKIGLESNTETFSSIFAKKGADWRSKLRQRAIEMQYIKSLEEEFDITFTSEKISPIIEQQEIEED